MTIGTTAISGSPATQAAPKATTLDQAAFLRLMTAQLQQQDPFSPMDNTQMVAQMAQFSSVAGISEINSTLRGLSDQMAVQTQLLADIAAAGRNP